MGLGSVGVHAAHDPHEAQVVAGGDVDDVATSGVGGPHGQAGVGDGVGDPAAPGRAAVDGRRWARRVVGLGEVVGGQPAGGRLGRHQHDQLLARTGGQHAEQVRVLHEPPRRRVVAADAERGDHHVALVALHGVHRADPQVERLEVVGAERGQDRRLDGVGLGPERAHHPHAAGAPAAQGAQLVDDGTNLGPHHAPGVARGVEAPHVDGVDAVGAGGAGGHRHVPAVEPRAQQLDEVGSAAELLVEAVDGGHAGGHVERAVAAHVEPGGEDAVGDAVAGQRRPLLIVAEERHVAQLVRIAHDDAPGTAGQRAHGQGLVDRRRLVEDHQVEQRRPGRQQVLDVGEGAGPQRQGGREAAAVAERGEVLAASRPAAAQGGGQRRDRRQGGAVAARLAAGVEGQPGRVGRAHRVLVVLEVDPGVVEAQAALGFQPAAHLGGPGVAECGGQAAAQRLGVVAGVGARHGQQVVERVPAAAAVEPPVVVVTGGGHDEPRHRVEVDGRVEQPGGQPAGLVGLPRRQGGQGLGGQPFGDPGAFAVAPLDGGGERSARLVARADRCRRGLPGGQVLGQRSASLVGPEHHRSWPGRALEQVHERIDAGVGARRQQHRAAAGQGVMGDRHHGVGLAGARCPGDHRHRTVAGVGQRPLLRGRQGERRDRVAVGTTRPGRLRAVAAVRAARAGCRRAVAVAVAGGGRRRVGSVEVEGVQGRPAVGPDGRPSAHALGPVQPRALGAGVDGGSGDDHETVPVDQLVGSWSGGDQLDGRVEREAGGPRGAVGEQLEAVQAPEHRGVDRLPGHAGERPAPEGQVALQPTAVGPGRDQGGQLGIAGGDEVGDVLAQPPLHPDGHRHQRQEDPTASSFDRGVAGEEQPADAQRPLLGPHQVDGGELVAQRGGDGHGGRLGPVAQHGVAHHAGELTAAGHVVIRHHRRRPGAGGQQLGGVAQREPLEPVEGDGQVGRPVGAVRGQVGEGLDHGRQRRRAAIDCAARVVPRCWPTAVDLPDLLGHGRTVAAADRSPIVLGSCSGLVAHRRPRRRSGLRLLAPRLMTSCPVPGPVVIRRTGVVRRGRSRALRPFPRRGGRAWLRVHPCG